MNTGDIVYNLRKFNAFNTKHSHRTLADHLLNTYELLNKNGCNEDVCLAGAFHSIYGTNSFTNVTISSENSLLKEIIGEKAERLVWLFHICNRPMDIEIGLLKNRFTGKPVLVDKQTISDLRNIEAANLIEQKCSIMPYNNIYNTWHKINN